jgi:hypothetical protein
MSIDLLSFSVEVDPTAIAGGCLWAFGLYIGFPSLREWITDQLERWFNWAERSLYFSAEEFERTKVAREGQNAFYASIFSIIPFLMLGSLCNYGVAWSLGRSWSISLGLMVCIGCGVYQLGHQDWAKHHGEDEDDL